MNHECRAIVDMLINDLRKFSSEVKVKLEVALGRVQT